jgi:hypothetical protein
MKKTLYVLLALLILGVVGYYVVWFKLATELDRQVDSAWQETQASGATIVGIKPKVAGFPFAPTVTFSGTITEKNGTGWSLPKITFRGFPLPGFAQHLEAPQGLEISGPLFPRSIQLDEAFLTIRLPLNLPTAFNETSVRAWQQANGEMPVERISFKAKELSVSGQGVLSLDDKLQPSGQIMTRVVGMDALLADLTEQGVMKGQSAIMAQSFLQMINQKDPQTGEVYFETPIRIQNRGVFLGPMRVGNLPEIVWQGMIPDPLSIRRTPPEPQSPSAP